MTVTVIGRGHSGTRAISHTLSRSGYDMGAQLNESGDLVPADELYQACRVMARHVRHLGDNQWDFSPLHTMPIDREFVNLVESYLSSVLASSSELRGWKLPETTLIYPWIVRMFPDIRYIHWVRDPRDCILGSHITDDLRDFGVEYEAPDDMYEMRTISWKYQQAIVRATPPPRRSIQIRFEDFVLDQPAALKRLEAFLGTALHAIEVRRESVGRWRTAQIPFDFSVFTEDLGRLEYE